MGSVQGLPPFSGPKYTFDSIIHGTQCLMGLSYSCFSVFLDSLFCSHPPNLQADSPSTEPANITMAPCALLGDNECLCEHILL